MPAEAAERTAVRLAAGCRPPLHAYEADVIILSLNRLDDTIEAVKSALAQRNAVLHVTVLDQGSEPDVLRGLVSTFGQATNFALYAAPRNLGVAGGRNLATALGHGEIIVALDNDARFASQWLVANALRVLRLNPDMGALGFNILAADGVSPDRFNWGYPKRLLPRFQDRFDTTTFVGAGHAIRRATWSAVGGYDSNFFFTWEEYDFCLAAIAMNWRIGYDGSLAVIHKVAADARIGWSRARMTYFVRNRLIIARKWGASWISLLPRMLGYLVLALRNRQARAALRGMRAAWEADIARRRKMPKPMRRYVEVNERRHRGSWLDRLRFEVFGQVKADP